MTALEFVAWFEELIAAPSVVIFFGVAVFFTLKTRILQFRGFGKFLTLITQGVAQRKQLTTDVTNNGTINSFHALFAAMATTIGMGNLAGPPVAIFVGGPGALFWLLIYIFFSSATKFSEVTFALYTRTITKSGEVVGGPMEYLKAVHPWLASWYTYLMVLILTSWSAVQSKTLAQVYAQEGVPEWVMGLIVVAVTSFVLLGGSQRVGLVASRIVPFMFVFYVTFALIFLVQDLPAVWSAIQLVLHSAFTPAAAMGGFAGASVYQAVRFGLYKGVFITEAGMGTSSIPHAVANTKNPTDQGILAMFSMISDAFLSTLSGLLVLSTGIWMQGEFRTTLLYEVFKMKSPMLGSIVLLITISLFVGTTIIGNTYNGRQVFASITGFRWVNWYVAFTMCMMFIATIANARDVWTMVDFLTPFAAIPNLIGLVILSFKYPKVLHVSDEK